MENKLETSVAGTALGTFADTLSDRAYHSQLNKLQYDRTKCRFVDESAVDASSKIGVPYLPREQFKDDAEYIIHLQRVIQLQRMTPDEFMADAAESRKALVGMYPERMALWGEFGTPRDKESLEQLANEVCIDLYEPTEVEKEIMEAHLVPNLTPNGEVNDISWAAPLIRVMDPVHVAIHDRMDQEEKELLLEVYIPAVDEPSPFGPDQKDHVDNPWIVWKRKQPGYNEKREGSASLLREELINRIKIGPKYTAAVLDHIPYELLGCANSKVSLGWVIHMYFNFGSKSWEEIHAVGQARIDYDKKRGQE